MLLTEKEAQTGVICPMMQRAGDPERTCCYGSGCAMWRWSDPCLDQRTRRCINVYAVTEPERPLSVPSSWIFEPYDDTDADLYAQWIEPMEDAIARRRGYCGLAGKPEER